MTAARADVAALYVERNGPYPTLVEQWFDIERDARNYRGDLPVVAHPPCETWGRLRHMATKDTHHLALHAVAMVRRFGGVLEHPASSSLWAECGLPEPDTMFPDQYGGMAYAVAQGDYGHAAPKLTWFYAVRLGPCPFHVPRGGQSGRVENLSKFARKATPPALAVELVRWAATAEPRP